jgi:hypothetical protein
MHWRTDTKNIRKSRRVTTNMEASMVDSLAPWEDYIPEVMLVVAIMDTTITRGTTPEAGVVVVVSTRTATK